MTNTLYQLPTVLILAALVGIFVALGRQNRTPRFLLWRAGWVLIFLRFTLQLVYRSLGLNHWLLPAIDLALMNISAVFFLASVTAVLNDSTLRWALLLSLSIPMVAYSTLYAYGVPSPAPYVVTLSVLLVSGVLWVWYWMRRRPFFAAAYSLALLAGGWWAIRRTVEGQLDVGLFSSLSVIFALTGILFWLRYKRFTPGTVTTCVGFFAWAALSPSGYYGDISLALPVLQDGLASVPKYLVAFGMIVTLLEDETLSARRMRQRERAQNEQMQRFAEITSRLLTGVDVKSFCSQIAVVVTEASNFQRAIVLLADEAGNIQVAGASGMAPTAIEQLQRTASQLNMSELAAVCSAGRQVGQLSCKCAASDLLHFGFAASERPYEPNPDWQASDVLLAPLRAPNGDMVGCILLDEPRDPGRVRVEDLSGLEMLAADVAVAVHNASLQRQLVRTEKLAGIGHLVAGVAHELNNPLTTVLGYTELLADNEGAPRRELDVVRREALRMKRIIENLMRFARQSKFDRRPVELQPILDDVVRMRAAEVSEHHIDLQLEIEPGLEPVLVDEMLLRQVLINVLGNALDAVSAQPERRVRLEAAQRGDMAEIRVKDSGKGFADLNRVFDPFYTTKGVGKGTGLGLSICYGIIKDHGGEIWAQNLQPNGACITMQLPVRASMPAMEPGSTRSTSAPGV